MRRKIIINKEGNTVFLIAEYGNKLTSQKVTTNFLPAVTFKNC